MNDSNLLATYPPFNTKLLNGNDVFLYDDKGNEYLDCLAGIAVVSLGHANVEIANVIAEQSKKLIHVSNYFENEYTPKSNLPLLKNSLSIYRSSDTQRTTNDFQQ